MKKLILGISVVLGCGALAMAQAPFSLPTVVVWESAARTETANSAEQTLPEGYRGVQLTLHITAASAADTLDVKLQGQAPYSGQWFDVSGATFQQSAAATGIRTLTVYPGPEGPGRIAVQAGADPAAGAEAAITVPVNTRWRLHGFQVTLVPDATVASRSTILNIDDGTTVVGRFGPAAAQTASVNATHSFVPGGAVSGTTTAAYVGLLSPNAIMSGGWRVRTTTTNLQAGDNYGAPAAQVEEWVGNYAGVHLPRQWRAVATIAGSSTSFTFSLAGTYLR
jgi:hypothetical protein